MRIQTPTFADLLKAAQESALQGMPGKAPPPAEKTAGAEPRDTLATTATKVASYDLELAAQLRKLATDAGTSPGVSQAKTPEDLPTSFGAATNNKPGLGKSSTSVQGPTGGPTGLEVSQAKTSEEKGKLGKTLEDLASFGKEHPTLAGSMAAALTHGVAGAAVAGGRGALAGAAGGAAGGAIGAHLAHRGHPFLGAVLGSPIGAVVGHAARDGEKKAAEPGPAIGGGSSPGTSSAEQSTGQPAGGKPQGPRHLIASTMAAINATAKDTYEPRKAEMSGLLSQTMNENDNTHQVFEHHHGAKTAASKGEDLSIKTASADELLRRLEAQIQGQVSA